MKEFLNSDFIQVVFSLILALGAVVVYNVSRYLYSKSTSIKNNIKYDEANSIYSLLCQIVVDCVQSTNQTFVDDLKEQGKWDDVTAKEAFEKTYKSVKNILENYLYVFKGDSDELIKQLIEKAVNALKNDNDSFDNSTKLEKISEPLFSNVFLSDDCYVDDESECEDYSENESDSNSETTE